MVAQSTLLIHISHPYNGESGVRDNMEFRHTALRILGLNSFYLLSHSRLKHQVILETSAVLKCAPLPALPFICTLLIFMCAKWAKCGHCSPVASGLTAPTETDICCMSFPNFLILFPAISHVFLLGASSAVSSWPWEAPLNRCNHNFHMFF